MYILQGVNVNIMEKLSDISIKLSKYLLFD